MEREKMMEVRNALYKMTLMGFIVFFAGILFCAVFPDFIAAISSYLFGAADIGQALLIVFSIMETLIIIFFLIPALALHWQYGNK